MDSVAGDVRYGIDAYRFSPGTAPTATAIPEPTATWSTCTQQNDSGPANSFGHGGSGGLVFRGSVGLAIEHVDMNVLVGLPIPVSASIAVLEFLEKCL